MPRLAVMAHFDVQGLVRPHVRRQVEALATSVDRLVVCSTAELTSDSRAWLGDRAELVERENQGYDFFSYRAGLEHAGDLSAYDEVTVCNDSYVFLGTSYRPIFDEMSARPVDFWGLTRAERMGPHVQSFFVTFRQPVVTSEAFGRFWAEMVPLDERIKVIRRYEVGMSRRLVEAGFRYDGYFVETPADQRAGRRRVRWWAAHRARPPRTVAELRLLRQRSRQPWNPSVALADRALDDARLPYVKIDTLRYDPYALDAARLLTLCEARFPGHLAGVRDYLDETRESYPVRENDRLHPTPLPLRPLLPLVRYADPS